MMAATRTGVFRTARAAAFVALFLCPASQAFAQLNEHCTVSVLNRTVQVNPDGSWLLPNVPAGTGQVRARATCVENGITRSGESDFFTITPNKMNAIPPIRFGTATPIPIALTITPSGAKLTSPNETQQLTVRATYPGGTARDVSGAATGTNYTTSNPAIATIGADGLVTAIANGTVFIQASNDGAPGMAVVTVAFAASTNDSDGDGIPDDAEILLGLDPQNPTDALEDPDRDGLTTLDEYQRGTDPRKNDSDNDGLSDGAEVGYSTNPLIADTDGDGVNDGLEVSTGSNPLDPTSTNIPGALRSLAVSPAVFGLSFNTIGGDVFQQLTVTGTLLDGSTLNLTTGRGVNYSSSDLNVCNFGGVDGRVFAGTDGTCTITASLGTSSATSHGSVRTFSPTALGFVDVPGAASVDVNGNFAYVAAGSDGLQVVDVTARTNPVVVAALPLPGTANDVKVAGSRAYVAAGSAGLHIVDISDPTAPVRLSTVDTPGDAVDVRVYGDRAYVADGSGGLQIISVSQASILGAIPIAGANGVDVSVGSGGAMPVAVVAGARLQFVDVTDPTAPAIVGSLDTLPSTPRDVVVNGSIAYVADYTGSLQIVSFGTPSTPTIVGRTNQDPSLGGVLEDVAFAAPYVFGADILFVNGVPIVDVSTPGSPQTRAILDFSNFRDDDGNGIAVDANYLYLTTNQGRLYIGQYLAIDDNGGVAPAVSLTSPAPDTTFVEGEQITMTATANDDVAVAGVNFTVDGTVVFTDTTAPYEFTLTAPIGATTLALSAIAVDFGGNFATAPNVAVTVIPDPLTTVIGRVIDAAGQPVASATVTVAGHTGTTGADGRFSIADVPTIRLSLVVGVLTVRDGETLTGSARATAVRDGITDVGDIVVKATAFEDDIGTRRANCTYCQVDVVLPFPFPIGGETVEQIHISNGHLSTDRGDFLEAFCCNLRGPDDGGGGEAGAMAAAEDLPPGLYVNDQLPGRLVVTWWRHDSFDGGPNTIQVILFADGKIQYGYQGIAPGAYAEVGLFLANGNVTRAVDFSASTGLTQTATENVYESFSATGNLFDLDGGFVVFTPRPESGYQISAVPDAIAPVCTVTNPLTGATLFEGEHLSVGANATDNGLIRRVTVQSSDGSLNRDNLGSSFSVPFVVPVGLSTVTFTVTAYDSWNNAGTCTSTNPVIPGPPPAISVASPASDAVLTAGATIPISIDATNRVPVESVELRVNGVALSTDATAPFEFQFTVPAGVNALTLSAFAVDTVGKTGTSAGVGVTVISDPLTSVHGRVVDTANAPVSGAQVNAALHGVALEVFDLSTPVTQFSDLPNLAGLTPDRTKVVSAINLRNPGGLFGADPFGIGTGSHATRLTARLETIGATEYTFTLGVNAGGQLFVNETLVVDLPNSTGGFQQGSGMISVPAGPIAIRIVAFDNGNPEVQLSYSAPGEELEVPETDEWTQTRVPDQATTTAGDGTFALANVPTVLGDLIVHASAQVAGRTARGSSPATAPLPGQTTNVGDIRLRGGRVLFLWADYEPNSARNDIVAAGIIPAEDIDTMDVRGATPTLAQLQDYGAVLVWSDFAFQDNVTLGNVLADYVDQGGGVVTATFSHFDQPWGLRGRLTSPGYAAFVAGGPTGSLTLSLANSNTGHPIMQGVTNASLSFGYTDYSGYSLAAGATVIARDTANHPKVAVNPSGRVVGIAIFPGFGLSPDLARMFANAIDFVR